MTKVQAHNALRRAYSAIGAESMVFLIAYLAIVAGLPIMIDPSTFAPTSVQLNLSDWLVRTWGLALFVGGTFSGLGLATDRPRIERAGLALLSAGALIFSLVIVTYAGWAGLLPCLTYGLFAWSSVARYRKLGKVLKGLLVANCYREMIRKEV
jgi:hypothetical protein